MDTTLNKFKASALMWAQRRRETELARNQLMRQLVDASVLSSDPGGLKKRHPSPAYDNERTYKPTGFDLTTQK